MHSFCRVLPHPHVCLNSMYTHALLRRQLAMTTAVHKVWDKLKNMDVDQRAKDYAALIPEYGDDIMKVVSQLGQFDSDLDNPKKRQQVYKGNFACCAQGYFLAYMGSCVRVALLSSPFPAIAVAFSELVPGRSFARLNSLVSTCHRPSFALVMYMCVSSVLRFVHLRVCDHPRRGPRGGLDEAGLG